MPNRVDRQDDVEIAIDKVCACIESRWMPFVDLSVMKLRVFVFFRIEGDSTLEDASRT
jgi:hypothetical protein